MELLLLVPTEYKDKMEKSLKDNKVNSRESEHTFDFLKYQILVDPSLYRILNDAIQNMSGARIEIVNQVVTKQGDIDLEVEVGHNNNTILAANSNVDSHTSELKSKVGVFLRDEDNSDVCEIEDISLSRRKAQKNNKKKNRKMKRRTADSGINDTSSGVLSNELESLGQSVIGTSALSDDINGSDLSSRKSCNTCGGFFDTPSEFRAHFKSDWHRFNQKLKLKGCTPISEKEFLICDSDTFFTNDDAL